MHYRTREFAHDFIVIFSSEKKCCLPEYVNAHINFIVESLLKATLNYKRKNLYVKDTSEENNEVL